MSTRPASRGATARWIALARGGDSAAYDRLFAHAAERLQLFLRVRLGAALRGREETLDLLQETYLAADRAFEGFEDRGDGAFMRWLCQIAENCIRARADHHGAQKRVPPGEAQRFSRVMQGMVAPQQGPATLAAGEDERQRVASALEKLPAEEREALLLRHFEGMTIDEVSERLGMSATSTRRLLGRATLRLGSGLGES